MSSKHPTAPTVSFVASPVRGAARPDGLPAQIGRYQVLGLLGRGGMGVVYLARDAVLGRDVAIKRIDRENGGAATRERLLREAQALARLAHPNVVAIHEVGEHGDDIFLAMELVAGDTLRAWRRARGRGHQEGIDVALQAGLGLAAAHAAGVVHRDIKPDNIMVGRDGRVRVMDFGLARAAHEPPPAEEAAGAAGPPTDASVTGALRGTPGFMAPELWHGRVADPRSDIYSFSVVLFELFTPSDVHPGMDAAALRAALREHVAARTLPGWLATVIERGLADDPTERWPSIAALLAALRDDPVARRRRRLRLAGLVTAVALVAVAAVLGLLELRARSLRAEAEQRAEAQRAAIAAAEDPEAAFAAFVADPEHRGTRALTRAWQERGDLARDDGRTDDALAAYARAYVEATTPADVAATFRSLAAVFAATWNGPALARAVDNLRALGFDDDELARQEVTAALALRDPAAAVAAIDRRPAAQDAGWRPTLAALREARPLGLRLDWLTPLPDGPAAYHAWISNGPSVLLDRDFAVVGTTGDELVEIPNTTLALKDRIEIVNLAAPGTVLWRADHPIIGITGVPLGDGRPPALIYQHSWPWLGFLRLDGLPGSVPVVRVADRDSHRVDSEFAYQWAADLDGDGRVELFAPFGGLRAYDLRVFQLDERGDLRLAARRTFGVAFASILMRRGGERLIAVVRDNAEPAPAIFPEPPHTGGPAGIHLLRWTGAALETVQVIPLPTGDPAAPLRPDNKITAVDLDDDGDDELVLVLRSSPFSLLVRPSAVGDEIRPLGGVYPLAAVQVDDDPADELVVKMLTTNDAWIVGAGDDALPTLPRPTVTPWSLAIADPWLAERAAHADELAAMGRAGESAAALAHLARVTADEPLQRRLLARAAALWSAAGDDERAIAIDGPLASDPQLGAAALARTAEALLRRGRPLAAHAAAVQLAAHPARTAEEAARAGALLARLAPFAAESFDLDLATSDTWQIRQPLGIRREAAGEAPVLTVATGREPLFEVPLAWDGEALAFTAEFEVRRLESGACLGVRILDESDTTVIGGRLCGQAGDGFLLRGSGCVAGAKEVGTRRVQMVESGASPARFEVGVVRYADGVTECTLEFAGRTHPDRVVGLPVVGRRLRLQVGSLRDVQRPALAEGRLRRLTVHGARRGDAPAESAWDRAARHLVEDDPVAAAAVLGDMSAGTPRERLLRVAVHDRLADLGGLTRAIDELAADALDPARLPDVALLIRTRPLAAAALLARFGPDLLPILAGVWDGLPAHAGDPGLRRGLLQELHAVHTLVPRTPAQQAALGFLLTLRGQLAEGEGHAPAAIRDYEAALALIEDDFGETHKSLAQLLAAADPQRARAHARAAIAASPVPELMREQLLREPALAGLVP